MSRPAIADVVVQARRWLDVDPDPETRAELEALLEEDGAELASRFAGRLEFGTAGLRGELGAGPQRMNRVLVRMTAAGLGRSVAATGGDRIVIGHDARRNSDVFADDCARALAAQGLECHLLTGNRPTPVLAYAVRHLDASAGVMITASHNPRADNGFKVYWSDGAQIAPPIDSHISAQIDAVGLISDADLAGADHPLIHRHGDELVDAYVAAAVSVLAPGSPRDVSVVYTPVHGVGRDVVLPAFAAAGFPAPTVVPEQSEPDPAFPTAAFPNPEEPGVLDFAIALAEREGADLVIGNDPDADRLAVVVPSRTGWRALTGNEIGCLLADHALAAGSGDDRIVVTTVVSSQMLRSIAALHGVHYQETLTGFKWVIRPSIERPDLRFVFGYEEALGYAVGDRVRDKDGISAALAFAELAAGAKASGRRVVDLLDDLERRHGVHLTDQRSFRFEGSDAQRLMADLMAGLRRNVPDRVGDVVVAAVRDLLGPDTGLPPADLLILELRDGTRLLMRPSGTEPKLKLYGEAVAEVGDDDLEAARVAARARLDAALDAMAALIA